MSNDDYVLPPQKRKGQTQVKPTSITNNEQSEENPLMAQGEILTANKVKHPPKKEEIKPLKDEITSKNTGKKLKKYIAPPPKNYNQGNIQNQRGSIYNQSNNQGQRGSGYSSVNNQNQKGRGYSSVNNQNQNGNSYSKRANYNQSANNKNPNSNPHPKKESIKLPNKGIGMYVSGYLFWMLVIIYNVEIETFWKILLVIYTLISNYTYCWYAEYQRESDGSFSWLFSKNWGLKAGGIFALVFRTFFIGLIFILLLELLKLAITIPIAFVTLFIHKFMKERYSLIK